MYWRKLRTRAQGALDPSVTWWSKLYDLTLEYLLAFFLRIIIPLSSVFVLQTALAIDDLVNENTCDFFDEGLNAVCSSIAFVNYIMF